MLYVLFTAAERVSGSYNGISFDFDNRFDVNWFNDSLVARIIKEIDKSRPIKDYIIESPVLGYIPPKLLSTTCKALILIYKTNYITNLSYIGDNGVNLLFDISKNQDVYCTSDNPYMSFHDVVGFKAICSNDSSRINSSREWLEKFLYFIYRPIDEHETDIRRYIK